MIMMKMSTKSDAQIQQDVLRELRWDGRVEETDIGVAVHHGIVTLTGSIDSYAAKLAAAEAAHRVVGVLDVANDLTVELPGAGVRTDTEIAQAVRQALEWDPLIPPKRIQTTVTTGWVTLSGTVDRWTQREDAAHAVRHLRGVVGVTNAITVVGPQAEPADIRTAIEQALERRAEREAMRIQVQVADGTVTLTGNVHSWAEKLAVLGAAEHVHGVHAVHDELRIAP
jgi:osmotically-inducible protein OsmY